jgi:hypothetical protein
VQLLVTLAPGYAVYCKLYCWQDYNRLEAASEAGMQAGSTQADFTNSCAQRSTAKATYDRNILKSNWAELLEASSRTVFGESPPSWEAGGLCSWLHTQAAVDAFLLTLNAARQG